jgi:hypothetical protein
MNALTRTLSPSATTQLQADHAHVLTAFQQFEPDTPADTKQVLANMVCRALDIHARLEEEIFYPAVRAIDSAIVDKNAAEHDEMRRFMIALRALDPASPYFDRTFLDLRRTVMHHVADEETLLFPEAERLLGESLHELGAAMARRRLELTLPLAPEITRDSFRALPTSLMLAGAGVLISGSYALRHAFKRIV